MIMETFEIMQELPNYDTETRSEQTLWENSANSFTQSRVATNLHSVKNVTPAKSNKAQ